VPAGTPKDVVAKLSDALKGALADPTVQQKMLGAGTVASYLPSDQLATRMQNDYAKWGKVIKDNNIKSD
jgi:tripartite-type tricarboxylate transporter receptor subunit TctC